MTSRKHEGFKVEKRTALIDFAEDSPWHGVEARVIASIPFETLFWFQQNAENAKAEMTAKAIRFFGDEFLIEWNVCDEDGKPYPATADGVTAVVDYDLITSLMAAWIEAVTNPPSNSSAMSNGSASLEEESMETLATVSTPLGN
jgi:hypothetical protein